MDCTHPEFGFGKKYDLLQELRKYPTAPNITLKPSEFRRHLELFLGPGPDVDALMRDLERGCVLGLDPARDPQSLSRKPAHFFRTLREAAFILDTIIKEARAAVLVPSKHRPLYYINFFAVPKKATDGSMTALRLIRNGKFAAVGCDSLNSFIKEEAWRIYSLPKLRTYARLLIDMKFMSIADLKDAFRQLPLRRDQRKFCGYSLFGQFWLDTRVAYGLSSSAASCQRFVELICLIFNNVSLRSAYNAAGKPDVSDCLNQILAYIDDFLLAARSEPQCREMARRFDALLATLGVRQSPSKRILATTKAVVYGWEWDLAVTPKTVAIPEPKLLELRQALLMGLKHRIVTVKALKKINGKLLHYSQIRTEAKVFIWNSTQSITRFMKSRNLGNHLCVLLTPSILRSWTLWYRNYDLFRSAPIASLLYRPSISVSAVTDASSTTAGYFVSDHWAYYDFQSDIMHQTIAVKEAHAIITMLHTRRHELKQRRVLIHCDNANVVSALIRRWSSSPVLMAFVGEIVMCLLRFKIFLWIDWISTHRNIFADALSRCRIRSFKRLCRLHCLVYRQKPDEIHYPNSYTFPSVTRDDDAREYARFCAWAQRAHRREPRWWCQDLNADFAKFLK